MIHKTRLNDVVSAVANGTRENPTNFYHTWYGWVSKGVLHVKSTSGARAREIWHFGIGQGTGSDLILKNTTGTAFCYTQASPEQETDPLRRALRLLSLPTTIVHRHNSGEVVELKGTWAHVDCNAHSAVSSILKTDATDSITEGKLRKGPGYYEEQDWLVQLTNATYAVVVGHSTDCDARISRRIWEIHLWGEADTAPVIKIVCEWMRGHGATVEMLEAKRNGGSLNWVAKNIAAGSAPWLLRAGDQEFPLYNNDGRVLLKGKYQYPESDNAIAAAINYGELGNEAILSILPAAQRKYEQAFADKTAAAAWLAQECKFFGKDGKLYLLSSPGRLRELEPGRYEQYGPVAVMNRHGLHADVLATAQRLGDPIQLSRLSYDEFEGEGVRVSCKTRSAGMFDDVKASEGFAAINDAFSFQVFKI